LFPIGDSAALAAELARVLDDASLRARLVEAGAKAVAPYDWSVVVTEVLRVYELAIAGASLR
jgi:phosphatidyl-myo-inositol alpha-mannosyltransferase